MGNKVLIYRLGSLGDTIIALPCFHKVKERFPNADITLLTNQPVAAIASPVEGVLGDKYFYNRVIHYPIATRNLFTITSLIKQIKQINIDTVVNLSANRSEISAMRDWLFFKAAGVKNLIGFPKKEEDFKLQFDKETNLYEWESKRLSRRIRSLGSIDLDDDNNWDLKLTSHEIKLAEQILSNNLDGPPIIAISIGTKCQSKDWGIDNWLQLLPKVNKSLPNWKLIIIGALEEAHLGDQLANVWSGETLNLCGKTSPRISAAILKQARVFVGHDSGPMHLAACVGTPSVAVFSARSLPGQWFPRGGNNQIIYHKTECAGCGLEECIVQKRKCLSSITVDEVKDAVLKVIPTNLLINPSSFKL